MDIKQENASLKDKVSRRNMQIKDLKKKIAEQLNSICLDYTDNDEATVEALVDNIMEYAKQLVS